MRHRFGSDIHTGLVSAMEKIGFTDLSHRLDTLHANQITMIGILHQLLAKDTTIMTALTDLQASVAAITAAVQAAVTDIQALAAQLAAAIARPTGTSDADVEAAVTQLNTLAASLQAAVTPPA